MSKENLKTRLEILTMEISILRRKLEACKKNQSDINSQEMLAISRVLDEKINEYYRLNKTGG